MLRDPTDQQAYRKMSQSLEKLDAIVESRAARERAELIQRTQVIGSQLAADNQLNMQAMNEINRDRVQILNGDDASATEPFILCGVDRETL